MFVKCYECGQKLGPESWALPTKDCLCEKCKKIYPQHTVNG